MITKEQLIEKLKPYFDAGVLTETFYVSDDMCVFNYGDMNYAAFPCMLYNDNYPIGMILPTELVEEDVDNHLQFLVRFKYHLKVNNSNMLHFSSNNVNIYAPFLEKIKKTLPSDLNDEISQRLKSKSEYKMNTK